MTTTQLEGLAARIERLLPQIENEGWLTCARLVRDYIGHAREVAKQRDALEAAR